MDDDGNNNNDDRHRSTSNENTNACGNILKRAGFCDDDGNENQPKQNWSGTIEYGPTESNRVVLPKSIDELCTIVKSCDRLPIRVVGRNRSLTTLTHGISGTLISLEHLNKILDFRPPKLSAASHQQSKRATSSSSSTATSSSCYCDYDNYENAVENQSDLIGSITVEGGITYAEIIQYLNVRKRGALRNFPSRPHVTVAGAIGTGAHGSGIHIRTLAADVSMIEFVIHDGTTRKYSRGQENCRKNKETDSNKAGDTDNTHILECCRVHLGCLGIVSRITLDVIPYYDVESYRYDDVPLINMIEHLPRLYHSCDSLSVWTSGQGKDTCWVVFRYFNFISKTEHRRQAAITIQTFVRGYFGRHPSRILTLVKDFLKHRRCVVKVQALGRGYLTRICSPSSVIVKDEKTRDACDKYRQILKKRTLEVQRIQALTRGFQARKSERIQEYVSEYLNHCAKIERQQAATTIQRATRGYIYRRPHRLQEIVLDFMARSRVDSSSHRGESAPAEDGRVVGGVILESKHNHNMKFLQTNILGDSGHLSQRMIQRCCADSENPQYFHHANKTVKANQSNPRGEGWYDISALTIENGLDTIVAAFDLQYEFFLPLPFAHRAINELWEVISSNEEFALSSPLRNRHRQKEKDDDKESTTSSPAIINSIQVRQVTCGDNWWLSPHQHWGKNDAGKVDISSNKNGDDDNVYKEESDSEIMLCLNIYFNGNSTTQHYNYEKCLCLIESTLKQYNSTVHWSKLASTTCSSYHCIREVFNNKNIQQGNFTKFQNLCQEHDPDGSTFFSPLMKNMLLVSTTGAEYNGDDEKVENAKRRFLKAGRGAVEACETESGACDLYAEAASDSDSNSNSDYHFDDYSRSNSESDSSSGVPVESSDSETDICI